MDASSEATEWRTRLIAAGFPNAADFDETTVMNTLFSNSSGRKKLLKWVTQKLQIKMLQIKSWRSEEDEDMTKLLNSFFNFKEHEIPRFIDGFLSRDSQAKIWKSIFFELSLNGMCTEESKEAREQFLLKDVTKVVLKPEVLSSLGYSAPEGSEDEARSIRTARALKMAEEVLSMEIPEAPENLEPVAKPNFAKLIESLESINSDVLSMDTPLNTGIMEQLANNSKMLETMAKLVQRSEVIDDIQEGVKED